MDMRGIFKDVALDATAMQNWKFVGRKLGVTENAIVGIEHRNQGGPSECVYACLLEWQSKAGANARDHVLFAALRDLNMNTIPDKYDPPVPDVGAPVQQAESVTSDYPESMQSGNIK